MATIKDIHGNIQTTSSNDVHSASLGMSLEQAIKNRQLPIPIETEEQIKSLHAAIQKILDEDGRIEDLSVEYTTDETGVPSVSADFTNGKLSFTFKNLKGTNGKSAYDIAVENGFVGTEGEWLASLKGEEGANAPLAQAISPTDTTHAVSGKAVADYVNQPYKSLKILAVGNSYARDAYSYVPYILREIAPDLDLTIGIIYKGSCTLATHWGNIQSGAATYEYDKWASQAGVWQTSTKKTFEHIVKDEPWDLITLQQQSSASRDYRTMQPYINNILDWLFTKVTHPVIYGWLMTPAYPTGYSKLTDNYGYGSVTDTSDTMFAKICTATQSVLSSTVIAFSIPVGTAIQNARTTSLDSLGDFGHLSAEGLHLQEGIPCLLEAYVVAIELLKLLGLGTIGIMGSTVRPTQSNITSWNVPQQNGQSTGVTEDNCLLSQKIAYMAHKNPYEITDCSIL